MATKKTTKKRATRNAASKKTPSAKQLAARAKFAAAAKARSKKAAKKRAPNKTVIVKPKRVLVVNGKRTRRKYRNGYLDLVIRGTAEKTAQGWKVGRKTIPQGKGIAPLSSGYYLDKATGMIFAKRERNVAQGFFDASGVFHPIRSSADYDGGTAGETGGKPRRTRSKKKRAATKKASATARHRAATASRKKTTSRLASRSLFRSTPLKRTRKRNSATASPKAKAIRKDFTGMESKKTTVLNAPNGTPTNLAKLGKLVLIKTENGTIKPPKQGTTWLCADAKGKLHIAFTHAYDGPLGNFGKVLQVEYEEKKPHLGYNKKTIFFHKLGEEDGRKPTLTADKEGLRFRGGAYKITSRGIVN